ncbi:protein STABILIZED1 [Panicum miliaceum]|uniref:Protein STABILIZED1 n=1 Tax=Panicum miliaceum TaxID=4540 RepID=A0A3L6T104_PANMI|nr:protein STABILIZED1 [Panicum miliaceum]
MRKDDRRDSNDRHLGKEQEPSQGDSQDDNMEDLIRDSSLEDEGTHMTHMHQTPLATFHPDLGLFQINSDTGRLQSQSREANTTEPEVPGPILPEMEDDSQQSLLTSQEEMPEDAKGQRGSVAEAVEKAPVCNEEGPCMLGTGKWPNQGEVSDMGSDIPSLIQDQNTAVASACPAVRPGPDPDPAPAARPARYDFLNSKPPPNYVAGLGRGAEKLETSDLNKSRGVEERVGAYS